ncbi:pectinesterase inhibitor 3-like [Vigna umbellata]|uniref:pectinesterase inhibitor 3-like n=1 Tax=Vigna umbellata TaxID=87088 RepID=UPI001F5FD79C|nr:pectinesterase inhibitor 3-like [Vigna umbellata]XP_047157845.1 pectinesterase inhibitor 3-like [Vigna umbellata]
MQTQPISTVAFTLFLLLLSPPRAAAARPPPDPLRTSCAQARYPALCVQTLSNLSNTAAKPLDLAQAAVRASLARTRGLSAYLWALKAASQGFELRQRVAVSDCVQQISDSVRELSKTLYELQHLRDNTFQWQMSNVQTWTSAALTNGDTCISGFNAVAAAAWNMKLELKQRVTDVSMFTSNALYLISRLADSVTGKPRANSGN